MLVLWMERQRCATARVQCMRKCQPYGSTTDDVALECNRKVVDLLLQRGVDVNAKTSRHMDYRGRESDRTTMHEAAEKGHENRTRTPTRSHLPNGRHYTWQVEVDIQPCCNY